MTTDPHESRVDPGILEIIGAVAEAIGLAEHVQQMFPVDRLKTERRHSRIEKQLALFTDRLEDARGAVRLLQGVVERANTDIPPGTIGFTIYASELPLYRRGLEQLQRAVRGMTAAAYTLEALTTASSNETERFYRISSAGQPVLRTLAATLAWVAGQEEQLTIAPRPVGVDSVLREADQYFTTCSTLLSERDKWLLG